MIGALSVPEEIMTSSEYIVVAAFNQLELLFQSSDIAPVHVFCPVLPKLIQKRLRNRALLSKDI